MAPEQNDHDFGEWACPAPLSGAESATLGADARSAKAALAPKPKRRRLHARRGADLYLHLDGRHGVDRRTAGGDPAGAAGCARIGPFDAARPDQDGRAHEVELHGRGRFCRGQPGRQRRQPQRNTGPRRHRCAGLWPQGRPTTPASSPCASRTCAHSSSGGPTSPRSSANGRNPRAASAAEFESDSGPGRRSLKSEGGFTLVEFLIATLIMSLVLGGTVGLATRISEGYQSQLDDSVVEQEARYALDWIARDLRSADSDPYNVIPANQGIWLDPNGGADNNDSIRVQADINPPARWRHRRRRARTSPSRSIQAPGRSRVRTRTWPLERWR